MTEDPAAPPHKHLIRKVPKEHQPGRNSLPKYTHFNERLATKAWCANYFMVLGWLYPKLCHLLPLNYRIVFTLSKSSQTEVVKQEAGKQADSIGFNSA